MAERARGKRQSLRGRVQMIMRGRRVTEVPTQTPAKAVDPPFDVRKSLSKRFFGRGFYEEIFTERLLRSSCY